jgi:hypothetical protein
MEGSRKFIAMWLGILGSWVIAKYGPSWGGVFATAQMILVPFLASVAYMLYNYVQKSTADKFVPENWLAGKRTFIGLLTAILAPILVSATADVKDAVAQTVTAGVELLIPVAYMVFQSLSDKKMSATEVAKPVVVSAQSPAAPAFAAPIQPVTTAAPAGEVVPVIPSVKERVAIARQMYGTWDGAKQVMLQTFKEAFETALRRMLRLNPNLKTIDAVRQAVLEVVGVQLDDKACEAIGQIPGFLGAVGANADIKIIGDFLDAIDRTPELSYFKPIFIKIAVKYAVKNILDTVVLRVQAGQGNESAKQALEEFGLTRWQIDKSQFSGGDLQIWYSTTNQRDSYGYRQFDQYMLAGVDSVTLEDLK